MNGKSPTSIKNPLGEYIRQQREADGISLSELAERSDVGKGTLSKLENGLMAQPGAGLLDRIARGLGISISELHAAAGFTAASMPPLPVYLRSQYRHLSKDQQAELTRQVIALTERYGAAPSSTGPSPGEDELD